ncbi:hypothetical protein LguiA_003416 [Lonicera macranthoides]
MSLLGLMKKKFAASALLPQHQWELDAAKELLLSLPLKGLQPNTCSYNIMISGLCKEGKLKEANTLFNKMEEKGCLPDGHTYNIIVQAFIWVMR